MAGRHIKALIAAHREADDLAFRRAAQALIDEEEAKQHHLLAGDLRRILSTGSGQIVATSYATLPDPPADRETALPLAAVTQPSVMLADLVLGSDLDRRLRDLVREVGVWPVLDEMGVPHRNKVLLYGPPGCGKSTIAAALAFELRRPLVTVRVDGVVSSYLGETAANLRRIFEFADSAPYVVLFDEFDSLGKDREDPNDHGELRRVVNALLQQIDSYQGPSILIAATNHPQVLDEALWRRFHEVVEVPLPSEGEMASVIRKLLTGRHTGHVDYRAAARVLGGLSHAAGELAAHDAVRNAIRRGARDASDADVQLAAQDTAKRRWA